MIPLLPIVVPLTLIFYLVAPVLVNTILPVLVPAEAGIKRTKIFVNAMLSAVLARVSFLTKPEVEDKEIRNSSSQLDNRDFYTFLCALTSSSLQAQKIPANVTNSAMVDALKSLKTIS